MVKVKEFPFSKLLIRYLLTMLLVLLTVLLLWIYISSNSSLRKQQLLNIQLNNRNSALVLDTFQEKLFDYINDAGDELSGFIEQEIPGHSSEVKTLPQNRSIPNLDLLRFTFPNGKAGLNADSPFFEFTGLDSLFSQNPEQFIDECYLLKTSSTNAPLWLAVSAKRVIQQDTGKVLGYFLGGIVLNHNLGLARELLQRSNAEIAILQIDNHIVSSSKPLSGTLHEDVIASHDGINHSKLNDGNRTARLIISKYGYRFYNNIPLSVVYVYHDTLHADLQRIFISSSFILLVMISCLFYLFYRFSNRQALLAVNNLLNYTREIPLHPETATYTTGQIREFNLIGKALEEMVARLNKATSELKEVKERMELVVNGADLGIWDWNIQDDRVIFNERWAEIIGYTLDEIEPSVNSWKSRVHPDDYDEVNYALSMHLSGKTSDYQTEHRIRHKDGSWVWILASGKVFSQSPEGLPTRAVGIHLDISRSKEAEKALSRERALLLSMINSIPDLIFYKDSESQYLGCNKAFEQLVGQSAEYIIGKNDYDLFPKELAEFFREKDQSMLQAGSSRRNEEWVTYPDGKSVLLDTLKTPFIGPDQEILGLIGVSRDITRIKATEQVLADERERLSVTLRSIGDGVITTDTEGCIVLLNKVAEELTGWTLEQARSKPIQDVFKIINKNSGEPVLNPVHDVLEHGQILEVTNQSILVDIKGARHHIAESASPITDRTGNIIGVVIVFRDITNEQRMENELLKVRKLESIGFLAGGIAHDFNNILSAIHGNLELAMLLASSENEKVQTLMASAKKATDRAAKLTQQLLTFSKGGEPVKETTSLPELIEESADFVLHGSKVSCDYHFAENLWKVEVDAGQISQVVQNIILNAKHSMPSGGVIRVDVNNVEAPAAPPSRQSPTERFVSISISDSGKGIPTNILENIFDPYFTTKQEGSGLGLAISHSIINKHNGKLTVESTEGKGTTFTIHLPEGVVHSITQKKEIKRTTHVANLNILVMDDDDMILSLIGEQLSNLGHLPNLVKNGEQAIEVFLEQMGHGPNFDIVIMDLTIRGGMGGKDACKALLEIDPDLKIIVASGYSNDPVMAHYQDYGFCAAILKPFDLDTLANVITKVAI